MNGYFFYIVDNTFDPLLVDKDTFINHYNEKGLTDIIHGLSWITESFGVLDQLRHDPSNTKIKKRLLDCILPELKKEPVGERAYKRLNEIETYVKMNHALNSLEEKLEPLLRELSNGYRILLQQFVGQ